MRQLLWSVEVEPPESCGKRIPLWIKICSPSIVRTWRWVEMLLRDPDFLVDLLAELEERPFVIHHRDVYSSLPYPQGEEDRDKTHVTISGNHF